MYSTAYNFFEVLNTFVNARRAVLEVHDGGELVNAKIPDKGGVVGLDKGCPDGLHVVVHRLQLTDRLGAKLAAGFVCEGRRVAKNAWVDVRQKEEVLTDEDEDVLKVLDEQLDLVRGVVLNDVLVGLVLFLGPVLDAVYVEEVGWKETA